MLSSVLTVGVYAVYQQLVEVLFHSESLAGSALQAEWHDSSLPTTALSR